MTSEQKKKYAIIVGALLHDIGKFVWRAHKKYQYTKHAELSREFFRDYVKQNPLFSNYPDFADQIEKYIDHHEVYHLIASADRISASERKNDESDITRRPLQPVSLNINIGKSIPKQTFFYEPKPIDTKINFPKIMEDNDTNKKWNSIIEETTDNLLQSYDSFTKEVSNIRANNIKTYCNTFYCLLEKYTSRIASAGYYSVPDISLFDHSRTVAAIALAKEYAGQTEKPFMLINGDISGIQNFIYKISSGDSSGTKKMAKRLRGRSFYINLLTDTITSLIIDHLDLFMANILFSGGGNFIILAQNTNDANEKLNLLEKEINKYLYTKFKGDLGVIISKAAFDDNFFSDYSSAIDHVMKINNENKSKKYYNILEDIFDVQITNSKDTLDVCPICQSDEEKNYIKTYGQCKNCEEHTYIGSNLLRTDYILKIKAKDLSREFILQYKIVSFDKLEYHWVFCQNKELNNVISILESQNTEEITITRINNLDFISEIDSKKKLNLAFGYKFIGNYAPSDKEGYILEFEELAMKNSENYPLLGVLRMDVDNLGKIFKDGFREDKSISRISTLSREFNLFFLGYINELSKKHETYIAYSGGDDVFVVGSWINIIEFAIDLRKDFSKFTCNNSNFTISGGIFFCKDKFPIGKAAELAGEEESKAKKFNNDEKDALSIFGKCIKWDKLYEVLSYAKELYSCLVEEEKESSSVTRGFVYQIYELSKNFEDNNGFNINLFKASLAKLHYLIARRGVTANKILETPNEKKVQLLQKLLNLDTQEYFKIIGSYILLKTRNN